MTPTVLILTTVHGPDDARIREKLARTLSGPMTVRYATRRPGPTDATDLEWVQLQGGRLRRNLRAWRLGFTARYDMLSLHDPETILLGVAVRLIRRKPVVFDLHEDLHSQIRTKVPWLLRPLLHGVAWLLLRLAGATLTITLAEAGYARRFKRPGPVFPNHPDHLPEISTQRRKVVTYVGDVTEMRGIPEAIEAAGRSGLALEVIGRIDARTRERLASAAAMAGADVSIVGPLPQPEAMERVAAAAVGICPLRDLPNYRHSLPTKVLEYLALGLPVVATDLPGTRRVIGDLDAVWLVPPGDTMAMARALTEAVQDEAITAATAQAAEIRARFRWDADAVLAVYLSTVR
ncbi:MAG: glycosyltransferase [Actinomycetota bacterium]|nr:glycosyltransferase [Actinomycetota bacterium]